MSKTTWGVPVEQTSIEKANELIKRFDFGAYRLFDYVVDENKHAAREIISSFIK